MWWIGDRAIASKKGWVEGYNMEATGAGSARPKRSRRGGVPRADAGIGPYGRKALPVVKPGTAANLLANIPLKRQIPKLR